MKKVRFESPAKTLKINAMNDSECHSPRPFIQKQVKSVPPMNYSDCQALSFTNDPVQRFDCGNSLPYPIVKKTYLSCTSKLGSNCPPSNDLDISILDYTLNEPRSTLPRQKIVHSNDMKTLHTNFKTIENKYSRILGPVENKIALNPPNVLSKKDDFFLRRDNINIKHLHSQLNDLQLDKENNPLIKKTEIMKLGIPNLPSMGTESIPSGQSLNEINHDCRCHHCIHVFNTQHNIKQQIHETGNNKKILENNYKMCHCTAIPSKMFTHCPYNCNPPPNRFVPFCICDNSSSRQTTATSQNIVDKKKWAIDKYEQSQIPVCLDVETQNNITKEKREPTVADLFKIIKLQNEQLQLLQEKVDKFISANKTSEMQSITQPVQNYVTEHVEVKSIGTEEKISIGVMTSFEMFRTSTIINKDVVKQNEAQIQCNRSQISIKEVLSKAHPVNLNFLDGITPVTHQTDFQVNRSNDQESIDLTKYTENAPVDRTFNETSLYNVQVDNAVTPQMSPEQSLYLDVRDYSDSDASSDDQSNVGWTYYNKVMTHVNGILQESDMPSSASALYRNGKQKCLHMQVDKTNVSVAKRVTFGDDQLGSHEQPHSKVPTTDTSLKMNQLAAKYLKNVPLTSKSPSPRLMTMPVDMSLATRNYMEKHKLLQGTNHQQNGHPKMELPKFLDITALKRQPKFL